MPTKELRFDGRVAIVTGSGNGLGREYALLLAKRGASVVVNDWGTSPAGHGNSPEPAHAVAAEIAAAGGIALPVVQTVATEEGAQAIVKAAVDRFGQIDILVNNAGIVAPKSLEQAGIEDYRAHLDVGLIGTANMSRLCWPHLRERRGNVVNVSSSSIYGQAELPAYAATRAAVWGFSQCIALDGERDGIRVNTLFPMGSTRTRDASGSAVPDEETRQFVEQGLIASRNAAMVAWLAHDSCPVNGRAFASGSDRAAEVFIAETDGYTHPGLSAEQIADNLPAITDRSTLHRFGSFGEYLGFLQSAWLANTAPLKT